MELSANLNDNGRWRADLKNWAEMQKIGQKIHSDDGEESGKSSDEASGSCISSRDDQDEDLCSGSSKATDLFLLGCVSLLGIILIINYTVL